MPRTLFHDIDPARVRAHLEEVSAEAAGRAEVLVACKYVPLEEMGALAAAGVTLVGENRQQDLAAKHERFAADFTWDFIGNLQSRKVRQILPLVRLIHSVATDSVLEQLGRHGTPETEVLIEVNVAEEEGKGGVLPADARRLHRPLPGPRLRPDDDAAVRRGSGGLAAPFRPPRRARRRQRSGSPLDGYFPGLARRARRGGDDHPARIGALCVIRR